MTQLSSRIIAHYERHATSWDADRQNAAWNDKVWHEIFVANLVKGGTVLDLGCGSGRPVAQYIAQLGFQVAGIDSSPTMISLCRSRLPDQKWVVADMRELSLGERFNGVLAWDSFFHLNHDDQRRMFAVFAAHAAPSAMLMFNAGPMHGEGVGSYRGDPLYHASLAPEEYVSLTNRFGFEVIKHVANDVRLEDVQRGFAGGGRALECLVLAQSRHQAQHTECPLCGHPRQGTKMFPK